MHARRPEADRGRGAASHVAAASLLALMAWMADSSAAHKSPTFDETSHLVSGLSYWRSGDFRLDPESGAFPQLWAALPAWWGGVRGPAFSGPRWERGEDWALAHDLLYADGGDGAGLLRGARRMILLLGLGLGAIVYAWSFRLFGPGGGLLSLWLYVFCPNLLAHSRLATADVAQALGFLAALASGAWMFRRVTPWRVLGCGACTGFLLLTKFGALLVVPVLGLLALLRALSPTSLRLGSREVRGVGRRLALLGASLAAVGVLAAVTIWAAYGFSYRARAEGHAFNWPRVEAVSGAVPTLVLAARDLRLLPEPWLYGLGYTHETTLQRVAFLRGEERSTGWWWYFPYCVAVKTPLGTLALWGLAVAAAARRIRRLRRSGTRDERWRAIEACAPLCALLAVYWIFSLGSNINIGVRHLLPVYAASFALSGAAWGLARGRLGRFAIPALLLASAAASLSVRPHYLAFFNASVGGPAGGYRQLIDSNLDWGQDLPALERWLAEERARGGAEPCYLSYFGSALPERHGVDCRRLPGFFDVFRRPDPRPLESGLYVVSATMLQALHLPGDARGPWTPAREAEWRQLRGALASGAGTDSGPLRGRYERLRFARLAAWLRQREPDAMIGYSLLVYRLDAEALRAALGHPPPG